MNIIFNNSKVYRFKLDNEDNLSKHFNKNLPYIVVCNATDLSAANQLLLTNILNAIQLDPKEEVSIIGLTDDQVLPIKKIPQGSRIKNIICFGISPDQLCLNIDILLNHFYHLEPFNIVFSNTLTELENDKEKKKSLWRCLKTSFSKS